MIPAILKWVPYTELGFFFYQIGKFCNELFKKNQNACTAKIAVSVDLLERIRWIQLYQSHDNEC
jgi:hypothetical protein